MQRKAFGKTGRPEAAALADPAAADAADASLATVLKGVKKRLEKRLEIKKGQAVGGGPLRKLLKFPEKPAWHRPRRFLCAADWIRFAICPLTGENASHR